MCDTERYSHIARHKTCVDRNTSLSCHGLRTNIALSRVRGSKYRKEQITKLKKEIEYENVTL